MEDYYFKVAGLGLQHQTQHSYKGVFYVFQIVQMALNRAKHLTCDDHIAVSLDSFFLSRFWQI